MNDTKHAPPPVPGDEQTGEPIESNISLLEYESSADGTTAVKATTTDGKQTTFTVELPDNISANVGREILKPLAEKLTQANDTEQEAEPPKVIELNITGADEDNYILTSDRNKLKTSDGEPLTFTAKIPKRFIHEPDLLQAAFDYLDKALQQAAGDIKALVPYLQKELDAVKDKPEYKDSALSDIIREGFTDTGEPAEGKYKPLIERAMLAAIAARKETAAEVTDLFKNAFAPMLTGEIVDDYTQLTTDNARVDPITKKAIIPTRNGQIAINHFDDLRKALSTSAKKILNTAIVYLTDSNYYKTSNANPQIEIPLIEYGEACGYQLTPRTMATPEEQAKENKAAQTRIKNFKKSIRRDLDDISDTRWTATVNTGRNKGDYASMSIISSHRIINGKITINFDIDAARFLVNAYVMQHPTALLKVDNRNPNAYAIGFKIAQQNSNDNNAIRGTDNTLSVKSLLAAAPEIQTIEELQERGQRNWKDKIKKPLEMSLQELINAGVLTRWEYRDPATCKTYTPATAQPMTWPQYSRLMVDYILTDAPDQTERRAAKAEAKAEAAKKKAAPAKPKGKTTRKPKG